jgi:hypothetical protein
MKLTLRLAGRVDRLEEKRNTRNTNVGSRWKAFSWKILIKIREENLEESYEIRCENIEKMETVMVT